MGCEGRAGVGQASLGPAPALPAPALLLSTPIKQPKHSLLCKQRPMGFMGLRVTMYLALSPSLPRRLARGAGPPGPSVHVFVPSVFLPLPAPGCCKPCVSLSLPSPGSTVGTQLGAGGGSAPNSSHSQAVTPALSKHRPQPSLAPSPGAMWDMFSP